MSSQPTVTEDYEAITTMADRLKLTGSLREEYIHKHMKRLGYRSVIKYVENSPDDDESSEFLSEQ